MEIRFFFYNSLTNFRQSRVTTTNKDRHLNWCVRKFLCSTQSLYTGTAQYDQCGGSSVSPAASGQNGTARPNFELPPELAHSTLNTVTYIDCFASVYILLLLLSFFRTKRMYVYTHKSATRTALTHRGARQLFVILVGIKTVAQVHFCVCVGKCAG